MLPPEVPRDNPAPAHTALPTHSFKPGDRVDVWQDAACAGGNPRKYCVAFDREVKAVLPGGKIELVTPARHYLLPPPRPVAAEMLDPAEYECRIRHDYPARQAKLAQKAGSPTR